jgi:hypothetical protein
MNIRTSLAFAVPSILLLLGGCIIVPGGSSGSAGGSGGEGNTTKTSSSSSASTGSGMGGAGGQGGAGGAGVGGGGGGCVKPSDGILDDLTCDKLNTKGVTCNGADALANGTCTHGAKIFQGGAFDVLAKCLQGIEGDIANACNDMKVSDCVDVMYAAACPSQESAVACEAIGTQGCPMGETFDTQGCLLDTNPLNTTALTALVECINMSPLPSCNDAYQDCFAKTFSF